MNQMDLKHTWSFDRHSRLIRFHLWAWNTTPRQLTFCALFWGYVFAIPNLFARLVWALLWPFRKGSYQGGQHLVAWTRRMKSRRYERKLLEFRTIDLAEDDEEDDGPNRLALFFAHPTVRKVAKWIAYGVMTCGGLLFLFALGWMMTFVPAGAAFMVDWFLSTDAWRVSALVIGLAIAGLGLFILLFKFFEGPGSRWMDKRRQRRMKTGDPSLKDVLVGGVWAVKTNTCPRIEIRDES